MCTVTFIPCKDHCVITSNRDEHHTRMPAIPPRLYSKDHAEIICPRDGNANGSWIAAKTNGDAAVLLNGAFVKHITSPPYRLSRGVVFLSIIYADSPHKEFQKILLENIEPFTMIILESGKLYEYRWDGSLKHEKLLNASEPHIWSSATLYNKEIAQERKKWFGDFLKENDALAQDDIIRFHRFSGKDDSHDHNLVMNRDGKLFTVSITSVSISSTQATMLYLDLVSNSHHTQRVILSHEKELSTGVDISVTAKSFLIKLFHWEYWPFHVVYGPIYWYWLWLCLKARSFFFFNTSNPLIKNGGFLLESKKEIYELIPQSWYPKTIFCPKGTQAEDALEKMRANELIFPVIAKPDIGMRGLKVKKIHSASELEQYMLESKVDFLIQDFVDYKSEVGIFYYKIPGEEKGRISGIVGKEFLTVTGDGESTIETLLKKEDRYLLQIPALKLAYGNLLRTILEKGERKVLVPYGNHARGAKFINLTHTINNKLTDTVETICSKVPGFYFGRLDIKYDNWDELCEGKNFSIIELNGAGSEPTHMYDPSHSIFFAWKEIIRHWKILYRISKLNHVSKGIPYMTTSAGLAMLRNNKKYVTLLS